MDELEILIDEAIERIRNGTSNIESDFVDRLRQFILSLDSSGGFLVKNGTDNKNKVAALEQAIDEILDEVGYLSAVSEFTGNFDIISDNVKVIHSDVNDIIIQDDLIIPYRQEILKSVTSDLISNGLNASLKNPIKDVLFEAVVSGGSLTDVLEGVEKLVTGNEEETGLLSRHVIQVSRDALFQYDGQLQNAIRQEFDFDAYIYLNSIVKDSRAQCRRWVKMRILLYSILEEEIEWAEKNGSGMIRGTTPQTFAKNRGGYACRHRAVPTRS